MSVDTLDIFLSLLVVAVCLCFFALWLTWPSNGLTRLERWLDRHPQAAGWFGKAADSWARAKLWFEKAFLY